MARYHLVSPSTLHLTDTTQANDLCYWKLHYDAPGMREGITLYLSPDGRYLTPTLYDVSLDPLEEERRRNAEVMKALLDGDAPSQGSVKAPVTIVEFSDYECPFSKRLTETLATDVLPAEGQNIRIVFRNFPLGIHPWAKTAALMSECAAHQSSSNFWSLNSFLFEKQKILKQDNIEQQVSSFVADRPEFDSNAFHSCLENHLGLGSLMRDMELGQVYGVHSTPTYFINGVRFEGAKDATQIRALIQAAIHNELLTSQN